MKLLLKHVPLVVIRKVRDQVRRPRSGKAKTTSDETGQRFLVGR
jgi:hypothetical protein